MASQPGEPDNWYYAAVDGTAKGPYHQSQLINLALSGVVTPNLLVWDGENVTNWIAFSEVSSLVAQLRQLRQSKERSSNAKRAKAAKTKAVAKSDGNSANAQKSTVDSSKLSVQKSEISDTQPSKNAVSVVSTDKPSSNRSSPTGKRGSMVKPNRMLTTFDAPPNRDQSSNANRLYRSRPHHYSTPLTTTSAMKALITAEVTTTDASDPNSSEAQQLYQKYATKYGYPPETTHKLLAFGKSHNIALKYSQCKDLLATAKKNVDLPMTNPVTTTVTPTVAAAEEKRVIDVKSNTPNKESKVAATVVSVNKSGSRVDMGKSRRKVAKLLNASDIVRHCRDEMAILSKQDLSEVERSELYSIVSEMSKNIVDLESHLTGLKADLQKFSKFGTKK